MIQRRAAAAGIATKIGNHTFRATGITAYLANRVVHEALGGIAWRAKSLRGEVTRNPVEPLLKGR